MQVSGLETQLATVTGEKEALQQHRERVSAQWEGRVRRLMKRLGEEQGEEAVVVSRESVCVCVVCCVSV